MSVNQTLTYDSFNNGKRGRNTKKVLNLKGIIHRSIFSHNLLIYTTMSYQTHMMFLKNIHWKWKWMKTGPFKLSN